MSVQQDEGQEGLEEGGLCDGAQEQVKVRSGGHHLLQRQLKQKQKQFTCKHQWFGSF